MEIFLGVCARGEDSNAKGVNGNSSDNTALNSGALYVFRFDGSSWGQDAYIKASNSELDDRFCDKAVISGDGNTILVSAPNEDSVDVGINGDELDNSATSSGAAYVFRHNGTIWYQQAYIKAPNGEAFDRFGVSLTISETGDVLAVGSVNESSNASGVDGNQNDNSMSKAGAVYLYRYNSGGWSSDAYLKAHEPDTLDLFGHDLDLISGGTKLAVSAIQDDSDEKGLGGLANDFSSNSGAVYIYQHHNGVWGFKHYIKASNTDASDMFGTALAFDANGSNLIVGSTEESSSSLDINGDSSDNSSIKSGAIYLY
ncbi:hypothetical protein P4S70_21000 [Enterovibrio sp. Hal110]